MSMFDPPHTEALRSAVNHFRVAWELGNQNLPPRTGIVAASGPPPEFIPWFCGATLLGYVSAARAQLLAAHLAPCRAQAHRMDWDAAGWTTAERSAALQSALLELHAQGHLPGWRNELFSFSTDACDTPLLQVERAGFYFLGMRSDAVHVNGFSTDGALWVARRSASKTVDPGLLDNLCAGGVAAGESLLSCLRRELYEEAGIQLQADHTLSAAGTVVVGRVRDGGWHEERLHVYNLLLSTHERPVNRDGEVQEFRSLDAQTLAQLVQAQAFTPDAAAAIVQGLGLA
jgi:8-oxo-dGTP pyrophosphatase MutT (NUDIX family)